MVKYIFLPSLYFPLAWKDRFDFLEDCLEQGAEGGDGPPPPLCFIPETVFFRGPPPPPATATLFTALLGWAQAPRLPVRLRTSSPRGDFPLSSYKHLKLLKPQSVFQIRVKCKCKFVLLKDISNKCKAVMRCTLLSIG